MKIRKKRIGFMIGNYHTDHPIRMVRLIWELLRDEDVELQVFLGTESSSFMKDFSMKSSRFDYQYASMCGYTQYEALDLLIISAGTLSIYQNSILLSEFLNNTSDIPKVLMETDQAKGDDIAIISDNEQGISDCVEHLISVHGLTRIGFITGPRNNQDAEERLEGYRKTLEKHGIDVREEYIGTGDFSENIDGVVEQLLDRVPDLEAIVSSNDEMAVAIYRVCNKRGLKVGEDIAVTGYDDMEMARYMDPPLTTARQDYHAFADAAVKSALRILRGENVSSQRIPSPFVRRCSCGCMEIEKNMRTLSANERDELVRNILRSREYQHNSWIGSLMNREMMMEVGDAKRFYADLGSFMAYLGTTASYLCLFEHPIAVNPGALAEFPEMIYVCMRQKGRKFEGYDWDEAPVMYRNQDDVENEFHMDGSFMTFLLFNGKYQYGILNVSIEPEKIDFYYILSLDIGTNLRYTELWAQQKMYRSELQEMAMTDNLTRLNNRAGVIHTREYMVGKVSRMGGVIMIDLDHLKQINDEFGHQEGDFALCSVGEILTRVIGKNQGEKVTRVTGRIGGDEFIVCVIDETEEQLREKVRQIKEEFARLNDESGKPYYVEISAGIASGRVRTMEDWSSLTEQADERMYEEKKSRREFIRRK